MKRILFSITLLFAVLLCRTPTADALTYGATYYDEHKQYAIFGNKNVDPVRLFINEVETTIAGTSGITSLFLTPGTAPASGEEGMLYADDSSDALMFHDGTN